MADLLERSIQYVDVESLPKPRQPRDHDREMLNEVCTHILHLANRTLTLYTGNYDQFEKARAEKAR